MSFRIHQAARAALFDIDGTLTDASNSNVWHTLIHASETSGIRRGWLYATGYPHYLVSKAGLSVQIRGGKLTSDDAYDLRKGSNMVGRLKKAVQIAGEVVEKLTLGKVIVSPTLDVWCRKSNRDKK